VDVISPTNFFGRMQAERTAYHFEDADVIASKSTANTKTIVTAPDASCNNTITIACLQALYKTGNYTAKSNKQKLGIAGAYLGGVLIL